LFISLMPFSHVTPLFSPPDAADFFAISMRRFHVIAATLRLMPMSLPPMPRF